MDKKKLLIIAGVVLSIIIAVILVIVIFFGKKVEEASTLIELSLDDPTVIKLKKELTSSWEFRNARFDNQNIPSDSLIRYVVDRMKREDYTTMKVRHEKVICRVTKKITFRSSKDCNIRIIKNKYFKQKQKEYFGVESDITFEDFTYKNLICRNDGSKYYCFVGTFTEPLRHFSAIEKVYFEDNTYYVYEYYLFLDVSKKDMCLKYFGHSYCDNYKKQNTPVLLDEVIKQNGVYYLHTFVQSDKGFYLKSSSLVLVD